MNGPGNEVTIAVVIPNRDDAAYLPDCLRSVLEQSGRPDEVVFVDDVSTDDSVAIAQRMLEGVSGSQILRSGQPLGTMGALNLGLSRVCSEYVLFLASNDFLQGELIADARQSIERLGRPGVWSAMVWMAGVDGEPQRLFAPALLSTHEVFLSPDTCISQASRLGNWFTGTTLLFHRQTLQAIGGLDVTHGGLADLLAALTLASLKGAVQVPRPYGVMRMHTGGFLWQTLTREDRLEPALQALKTQGPKRSPKLFSDGFCQRTEQRFRFAALRAMEGRAWPEGPAWQTAELAGLRALWPCVPSGRARIALAFLLLRHYDVLPTFWYRWAKPWWVGRTYSLKRMKKTGKRLGFAQ
jgi:hypothetical protein